jgi:hypothetical protein
MKFALVVANMQVALITMLRPVLFALSLCLVSCSAQHTPISIRGEFLGSDFNTTVDSAIAKYYVESYLPGIRSTSEWDVILDDIHTSFDETMPTTEALARISRDYSTDLGALVLAQQLSRRAQYQPLFGIYREELSALLNETQPRLGTATLLDSDALFLFVPGWLYQTDATTGADFARFRALLTAHGAKVELMKMAENATVEENAALLATRIRQLTVTPTRIIIVSGSKGGPESALALSMLRNEPSIQLVAAWINIGGLLQGSPLADFALTWPMCWFVQMAVLPDGSFAGIRSLSSTASQLRLQQIHVPDNILVVNLVGIPLSGQISDQARLGYAQLRSFGPNDGLTLLTNAVHARGVTIPVFGADHYFRIGDIETRTLALARAVTRSLSH